MGENEKGRDMSKIAGEINMEMMKNSKVIHNSRLALFKELVMKTGPTQSVLDCFMQEIEELRQQLADVIQTSFDLCPECGWRTLIPEDGCIMCSATSVEAEREQCAKACDEIAEDWRGANSQAQECATAIRNRGTK